MPRSTKSRGVATLEREEEDTAVTTAQDQDDLVDEVDEDDEGEVGDPSFTFESFPAPKGFQPDRKAPGRVRRPSYFDNILRRDDVFESGEWQMVPVQSPEHLEAVKRELNRAKLWLNKTGLEQDPPLPEIGLDMDEREDAVYYRARKAQKRERKNGNGTTPTDTDSAEEYEEDSAE